MSIVIAFCNCPTADTANALANGAVERRLAACVNIFPDRGVGIPVGRSHCQRDGIHAAHQNHARDCIPALKAFIEAFHPYDTPELIVLDVTDGLPAYLAWVAAESKPPSGDPM